MELGEKLRQARLESGLSQRQLAEGFITRNMLSLIESGRARPSMDTLQQLSARLGKPVSWFLEEDAAVSPNQPVMESARAFFASGDLSSALEVMEAYQDRDPVYDREAKLLRALLYLGLGQQAIEAGRFPYALELLDKVDQDIPYCADALRRRKLLLLGRIPGQRVSPLLPSLDEELLIRSEEAFCDGNTLRAEQLLDAAEDRESARWNLLRGTLFLSRKEYRQAALCLHKAEEAFPGETAALLEDCYRELGDYRRAYEYACKKRRQ